MTRRQLLIILAVVGVGLLLYAPGLLRRAGVGVGTPGPAPFGPAAVPEEPPELLRIRDGRTGDTARLEPGTGGWTVNGRPADSADVAALLAALPTLASHELAARNPRNHARLGVAEDSAWHVEIRWRDGSAFTFLRGGREYVTGAYYVREAGEDDVYLLGGAVGAYVGQGPDEWRERRIAAVDTAAVREMRLRRGEAPAFTLRRVADGWRVDEAAADTAAVGRLLRRLDGLDAVGFPPDSVATALDFSAPDALLHVFTAGGEGADDVTGRTLALSLRFLGPEGEGGAWQVRHADGSEVYELQERMVELLVPEREALVAREGPEVEEGGA